MQVAFGKLPIAMSAGNEVVGTIALAYIRWVNPGSTGDTYKLQDPWEKPWSLDFGARRFSVTDLV